MNGRKRQGAAVLALWGAGALAQAQLPITVEDLFVKQGRKEVSASFIYGNSQRADLNGLAANDDRLTLGLDARFGVLADTELSLDASTTYVDRRLRGAQGEPLPSGRRRAQLGLGFSHRFSKDAETPAFLVFGRVGLAEWGASYAEDIEYGRQVSLGALLYRTIDPVLLSVSALIFHYGEVLVEEPGQPVQELEGGYAVQIAPRLSFFVNGSVTLAAGFAWVWNDKPRVDGQAQSINETSTSLSYGLGYAISDDTSLHFEGRLDTTGDDGAILRLELIHRM